MIRELLEKLDTKIIVDKANNLAKSAEKTVELCRVNGHILETVRKKKDIRLQ